LLPDIQIEILIQ